MGKVLDWFTQLLIGMDNEEDYVNIGRRLLSVNKYAVNTASTSEALHEVSRVPLMQIVMHLDQITGYRYFGRK